MLTGRDGPGRTHASRVTRGTAFARDAGTWHWSPDYLTLPHPICGVDGRINGTWVRKHARARGKRARREERVQRRLMREGRGDLVLERLRDVVRRKLVTVFQRRPNAPPAPIVVPGGGAPVTV